MNPINKEAVSKRIRELRKKNEMTLEAWAALFGSNKSAGFKWENGTVPYRKTLEKMAEFSNVSIDWILHGDFVDYVIEFLKQFPIFYGMLKNGEDEDYFSSLADRLIKDDKTYGDDTAILIEIARDPIIQATFSFLPEIRDYLKDNQIEIKDLNVLPVDNFPEYRFQYIHKVDDLFMSEPRLSEWEDFTDSETKNKLYDVGTIFSVMTDYIIKQEALLKEWKFDSDENNNEEVEAKLRERQKKKYILDSLVAEQLVLEMLDIYETIRERVAEKYSLDLSAIEDSRPLTYYEIKANEHLLDIEKIEI